MHIKQIIKSHSRYDFRNIMNICPYKFFMTLIRISNYVNLARKSNFVRHFLSWKLFQSYNCKIGNDTWTMTVWFKNSKLWCGWSKIRVHVKIFLKFLLNSFWDVEIGYVIKKDTLKHLLKWTSTIKILIRKENYQKDAVETD